MKHEYDSEHFKVIVGNRLKAMRDDVRKKSVRDLADAIGCNERTIQNYESGQSMPLEKMLKACNFLQCDMDYLLGVHDEPTQETADICSITGLSTATVETLIVNKNQVDEVCEKVPGSKDMLAMLIDEIAADEDGLLGDIFFLLFAKYETRKMEKEKHFSDYMKVYEEVIEDKTLLNLGIYYKHSLQENSFRNKLKENGLKEDYPFNFDSLEAYSNIEKIEMAIAYKFVKILEKLEY